MNRCSRIARSRLAAVATLLSFCCSGAAEQLAVQFGKLGIHLDRSPASQSFLVQPNGTLFEWADEGITLEFPPGAVDEEIELTLEITPGSLINKSLYVRNKVSQHFKGRVIGGVKYPGTHLSTDIAGFKLRPEAIQFQQPVRIQLVRYGVIPSYLRLATFGEPGYIKFLPGSVDAQKLSPATLGRESGFPTFSISFSTNETGIYLLTNLSENSVPDAVEFECPNEDPCRCLRYRVETGEFDYSIGDCQVLQRDSRIQYLDCPGQPVFEDIESELSKSCQDVEEIPDLLDFAPGKKWGFSFDRRRVRPLLRDADDRCQSGRQEIAHELEGQFVILPEETPDGRQKLAADATIQLRSTLGRCETQGIHQAEESSGPITAIPIEFWGAELTWHAVKRPSLNLTFVLRSDDVPSSANYVFSRERYWDFLENRWGEWRELRVPLEYQRLFGIGLIESRAYEISRQYHGTEWPWPWLEFFMIQSPVPSDLPLREYNDSVKIVAPAPFDE